MWATLLEGNEWRGRLHNRRKNGSLYHESQTITPVIDESNEITHFIAIKQDISEQVKAEESLQKWAHLFAHADWGVVTVSADGQIFELMNPAFARMHGYTVEELTGMPISHVILPEYRNEVPDHIKMAHENGHHSFESRHIRKDGTTFPVFVNITAVKGPENNVLYHAVNVQDITNLVNAQTEIRQKSAELALINRLNHAANQGDSLPKIIELLRQEMKTIFAANDASLYLLSPDKEFLLLQNMSLGSKLVGKIEQLIGEEITVVKIHLHEGGHYHKTLSEGQPVFTNDLKLIQQMAAEHTENVLLKKLVPQIVRLIDIRAVMHIPLLSDGQPIGLLDIARQAPFELLDLKQLTRVAEQLTAVIQRKQAEEALKLINKNNRLILQAAAEGIYGVDTDGKAIFVNAAAEHMLGWQANELIGKNLHYIVHHTRADGSPSPLEACPIHATIKYGMPHRSTNDLYWRKDGSSFPVEYASSPIFETGQQVGAVVTFIDISERLRQEEYLKAQQRLATVGQLAAGIAHDFNNIMAVISLYTDLTIKMLDPNDGSQKRLLTIREQANRAADLIQQILDFSRQTVMERRQTDLRPFLKELLKLLTRTMPENIQIQFDHDEGQFIVHIDPTQMQQMLLNLIVNARDAMSVGGVLQLRLTQVHLAEGVTPPLPDIPPGDWVQLDIADTGHGIDRENLSRVFEPFFTTKPVGKGTGLGLAQVYGIVKQHNGYVGVSSQVDVGTVFSIYLPSAAGDEESGLHNEPASSLPQGNGETILVVEDEEAIRTAVCEILASLNYQSLSAANGDEALHIFKQNVDTIALVLSDMMMPGMNGLELGSQLYAINPNLKMILLSGYPLEEKNLWQRDGILNWIKKPVSMKQLAEVLQQALNA